MKGTQSVENLVLVCFWGPSLDDLWEPGLTCHDLRKNRTVKQQGQLVYCKVHTYRVSVFVSKTFGQCRCVVDPVSFPLILFHHYAKFGHLHSFRCNTTMDSQKW